MSAHDTFVDEGEIRGGVARMNLQFLHVEDEEVAGNDNDNDDNDNRENDDEDDDDDDGGSDGDNEELSATSTFFSLLSTQHNSGKFPS